MDLRNDEVGAPLVDLAKLAQVLSLGFEVQLLVDGPVEFLDDAGWAVEADLLDHRFEQAGQVVEQVDVGLDLGADVRPLNLDHDLVAVAVRSADVHLGDRGAGERGSSEAKPSATGRPRPASI